VFIFFAFFCKPSFLGAKEIELIIKFNFTNTDKMNKSVGVDSNLIQHLQRRLGNFQYKPLIPEPETTSLQKGNRNLFNNVFILRLAEHQYSTHLLDSLNTIPSVEYVCHNHILKIHQSSDDPEFSKLYRTG
jgi:hypothetical protein